MTMIVPLFNTIVLPETPIFITTESFRKATLKEPAVGDKYILLIAKNELNIEDYTEEDFYPIGLTASITEVNVNGYIVMETHTRCYVDNIQFHADHTMEADSIVRVADVEDLDPKKEKQILDSLKRALVEMTSKYQWGIAARGWIMQWDSLSTLACTLSQWLSISYEEKYALLAEDSQAKRAEMIERIVYEYTEFTNISNEASDAQEESNKKLYREAAIRKQLEYLQNELDEMHPENVSDVAKLTKKVEESGMNETARKEADKVLSRLNNEGQSSPEYGNLYNYLDFLTSLPWKKEEMEQIDLQEAEKILDEDHYGLAKPKKRILQQIAVMDLNHKQAGSILLFVGAPGTGKTSIGKSIAKALKRKYVRVSLGGVRDEADIRGHRRTYIGAMPGRIMDGIQKAGSTNPVMVLDEVDKLGTSYNGDPSAALLEVLDPEQNNTFTDHYMNVPYDLSDVLFICTANTLDSIPEPLLNRMEVIEFSGYTASEKYQIARRHLLPKAMASMGIPNGKLKISEEALRTIISDYTMEGGVRGLKKRLDTLCRSTAVEFAKGRKSLSVTKRNLPEYLDMKPLHHDHVLALKKPGIVTGLAWTQAGGDILFIETVLTKGKGNIIVTGQLGDVMKESVQIAISLVKSMFPELADVFNDHDLHVHVPQGAVKKDGPSAGITLTTAISSLVTNTPVAPTFAMTGEVSLRGMVMPIGGLPEKLMAATRAGVKTVFIPKENVEDLKDVADEVKEKLEIIPVTQVNDVLKRVGILPNKKK